LKPSRNAFRHGLSVSLRIEMETLAKAEATACAFRGIVSTDFAAS
jgi:hypothetical protein